MDSEEWGSFSWYEALLAKSRARRHKWRYHNYDKIRAWYRVNHERVRVSGRTHTARYQAARLNAVPRWLTKAHWAAISKFYSDADTIAKTSGIPHHVDHIVPLRGKLVCGLHVPWNLQVLPGWDNCSKGNRFAVY
jgi:hypothetical protein